MTKRQQIVQDNAIGRMRRAIWDAEELGAITARKAGQLDRIIAGATEGRK